jgi:hypothetical protein
LVPCSGCGRKNIGVFLDMTDESLSPGHHLFREATDAVIQVSSLRGVRGPAGMIVHRVAGSFDLLVRVFMTLLWFRD